MRWSLLDAGVAILAAAILSYGLLVVRRPIFAVAAAAGLTVSYSTWQQNQTEHAVVLAILWGLLAIASWTARFEYVLVATLVTAVLYLGWDSVRGRGRLPA